MADKSGMGPYNRMPMQYTPDQPQSYDQVIAQRMLEAGIAPHVIAGILRGGIAGGVGGAIGGGMAGGPVGAAAMGGVGAVAGGLLGAAGGAMDGMGRMSGARMTSQMPPMPQYGAQPPLDAQMPPMPSYPPNVPPNANSLRRIVDSLR